MSETLNPVTTPERHIYPPTTISPEARASLSTGAAAPRGPWPDPDDGAGWQARIAQSAAMWGPIAETMIANAAATLVDEIIAGVRCYEARPTGLGEDANRPIYLFAHGGAFVFGGGDFARAHASVNADRLGCACISVDYRMPPEHPFPAAPEDVVTVYAALLERWPGTPIFFGGSSAGGNIAAAAMLLIRDRGLPMPAGLILLTPEVDLTESGDSFRTNELLDVVLKTSLAPANALYAAGTPLDDPILSPLFADLGGFPPTFIQTGTRDLFLSNSVLFHRKLRAAGARADLHVWEGMPHSGFGGATPEDAEIYAEVKAFIASLI